MASPKPLDPSESPRAFYGAEVRRLREARGLSQEALGEMLFFSGAYIGQIESAIRRPQEDLSERLDAALGTDGHFTRLYRLASRSRFAEYFTAALELEPLAKTISTYASAIVPGLLQTPEYARTIFRSAQPLRSASDISERVSLRMDRAQILDGPTSPLLWVVMDETTIRRPVGGAAVMAEQLSFISGLIRENRIIVQVLPFSAGAHALLEGTLLLMTFADAPPVAYIEGPHVGTLLDDPSATSKCALSFDLVRAAALSPEASLTLIESAAEEYANGQD
ncbi:Scr1 family TA system antitoxin-like transcriptional regulator [Kitasatospora sp. NPDC059673]|uniref:helix-turn-helix domain-containing protein n=1 Tax=Kitasatospora sp. NPDC059673 TaxID=3346901 RepID=UPI0036ADF041